MDNQQLADIETELDLSVDSSALWLEGFIERVELDEDDYETLVTIIDNLFEAADYIRGELGIGGEEEDTEEDDEYDSHLGPILDEDDEEDTPTFVGTWDSIRFLEDENGEVTGIQVDFA